MLNRSQTHNILESRGYRLAIKRTVLLKKKKVKKTRKSESREKETNMQKDAVGFKRNVRYFGNLRKV